MDEYVIVEKSNLQSIADTVRATTGSTESIAINNLGSEVAVAVSSGGGGAGVRSFEKTFEVPSLYTGGVFSLITRDELQNAGFLTAEDGTYIPNMRRFFDNIIVIMRQVGNSFQTKQCFYSITESSRKSYHGGTNGSSSYNRYTLYHRTNTTSYSVMCYNDKGLSNNVNGYINIDSESVAFATNSSYGLYGTYVVTIIGIGKRNNGEEVE